MRLFLKNFAPLTFACKFFLDFTVYFHIVPHFFLHFRIIESWVSFGSFACNFFLEFHEIFIIICYLNFRIIVKVVQWVTQMMTLLPTLLRTPSTLVMMKVIKVFQKKFERKNIKDLILWRKFDTFLNWILLKV